MLKERSVLPSARKRPTANSIASRCRLVVKIAILVCASFMFARGYTLSGQKTGRVLVLYEQGLGTRAVSLADREIRDVLEKQSSYQIDFYTEYMETELLTRLGLTREAFLSGISGNIKVISLTSSSPADQRPFGS